MGRPSYKELEDKVKELQQLVNIKVFPTKPYFLSDELLYFRLNRKWSFDFFDPGVSKITGYSAKELQEPSFNWLEIVYPEDRANVMEELERSLASDKSFYLVQRITQKGGQIRWVKIRGSVFCDDDDRFNIIQGIISDVTREKRIEEALESEYEIFTWVANGLEDGIYIVSDDYRIKFMNQALLNLLGDHVGELCYNALFDRDKVCSWSVMHHIQKDSCGLQDYYLDKLGRTFQVRSFPLKMRDGSIGKLGQMKDITRTKILQYELKEITLRQEALAFAADAANVGVFIAQHYKNLEAGLRYTNKAFCNITGYDELELLEMSLSQILPPNCYEKVEDFLDGGNSPVNRTSSCEVNLIRKDGSSIIGFFTASSSIYLGRPAISGFLQDITETRKVQESLWLSQRLASIGKLAAEIAHEINNPLTSILTFTKLAARIIDRESSESESLSTLRQYLSFLESEANRCSVIARNLLDFSRQGEIEIRENDLGEIFEKTLDILRHRAEMGSILVDSVHDTSMPKIHCDFKRLQQAFMNILWNAIEAMPDGGTLKIRSTYDRNKQKVLLSISDTGIGIPEENLDKIFEPFFTTKAESKGVGLGLSVSYGIIRQHGGDIHIQSRVGEGTRFDIQLPTDTQPSLDLKCNALLR
jgi:PAS domain S-box-containing protein